MTVGVMDGFKVGIAVGFDDGDALGKELGFWLGCKLGVVLGDALGWSSPLTTDSLPNVFSLGVWQLGLKLGETIAVGGSVGEFVGVKLELSTINSSSL
jgi:hypothetical protein